MAYFRCTEIGNAIPSPKTPCICSSGSQLLTIPTIDGHQPYIIDTKIRLPGASPSTVNSYFLGNGHDTSYGGGWYLRFTNGAYNTEGGWIRLYDSHGTKIGDINPPQDIWFDVLCGPKRTKFYNVDTSYDTMPGDESIKDYKLSLFGITQSPTSNLSSIAIARTKITLDDVLVADLVPVNELADEYVVTEYTRNNPSDGSAIYYNDIAQMTFYRENICIHMELRDETNNMTYYDNHIISLSDFIASNYRQNLQYTWDNGLISSNYWILNNFIGACCTSSQVDLSNMTLYVKVTIQGANKEGQFYDTINNKYYFSETSTPLVYTEL